MFGRLWRQRRLIVLNCIAAFLAATINPALLAPLAAFLPPSQANAVTFTVIVLALSLIVCHLAPRWRWIPFSLILGYAVGEAGSRALMPQFLEILPDMLFTLDEQGKPAGPGPVIVAVLSIVAMLLIRMFGHLLNVIRLNAPRETVVGGVIRRPRAELWSIMAPEMTKTHWNPEIQLVDRDRMDPQLGHVVYWRKFGIDYARRIRRIEDEIPLQQFRDVIADDARSTTTRGMSGSTGWLLEDHPKGTYLTMREEIAGLGRMTLLWRWFDDFEKDYFVFLRAHLEGGRDWSLYGLDVVTGEHPDALLI
jgi:hypothetical protein